MPVVELIAVLLLVLLAVTPFSVTLPTRETQENPGQLENRFTSEYELHNGEFVK